MARYKVFLVDSGRRVICAAKLDCLDEQTARDRAEQMRGEHDLELWHDDRLVAVFRGAKTIRPTVSGLNKAVPQRD
jgi:hypothetical protein